MTVKELCEKYNPKKVCCYCFPPEGLEDILFYGIGYWEDGHLVTEDFYEADTVYIYEYDAKLNQITIVIDIDWRS